MNCILNTSCDECVFENLNGGCLIDMNHPPEMAEESYCLFCGNHCTCEEEKPCGHNEPCFQNGEAVWGHEGGTLCLHAVEDNSGTTCGLTGERTSVYIRGDK